jgi:2-oxoglutarate dehydrogenase E2 component (dihydrolipoamide succinyltransferase)
LSKKTSPHVTSFEEAHVSKIVAWREKVKLEFQKKYNEKITYLPIIIEAVVNALKDFPSINASLHNETLIIKKDINIGIATALSNGNLIVPVIKHADALGISGLVKSINALTQKARESNLTLTEIQGSTFTVSNIGTFGNIGGTPIINQPELAILAIGAIIKKPVAVKTNAGYGIAIQDMVELWLSYDHRIIDGFLGGSFLKRIADNLEQFDEATTI